MIEGTIHLQSNGRYAIGDRELTSGDRCELLERRTAKFRMWLKGRIEHGHGGYYFIWESAAPNNPGVCINLADGMQMRIKQS